MYSLRTRERRSDDMATTTIQQTMQTFPTLYRRPKRNFLPTEPAVIRLAKGANKTHTRSVTFPSPGWLAFDFAASVAHTLDGQVALGKFQLYVDGILRWEVRGAYTFTRAYVFVDEGSHTFEWKTNDEYKSDDQAMLRNITGTAFDKVDVGAIEKASPPNPIQELTRFAVIDGYDRYQQTGSGGAEITFTLTFVPKNGKSAQEHYDEFAAEYINFYILRYNFGLYGGALTGQLKAENNGPLVHAPCTLNTAQRAGVSVVGI